jgi:hypothetical protein
MAIGRFHRRGHSSSGLHALKIQQGVGVKLGIIADYVALAFMRTSSDAKGCVAANSEDSSLPQSLPQRS